MPAHSLPKPHKTYEELVSLLKDRGMIVSDEERTKRKLSQIGYYRLSGFWYPCRKGKRDENGNYVKDPKSNLPIREDSFQNGTEFNAITELYLFDKKLRQLMTDAIERIEIHIRSVIAHEIGRFDPLAYLDTSYVEPKILSKTIWCDWRQRQESLIKGSKEDCIIWHLKNKKPIPFWVVVETWDFGLMSKYFENLKGRYQNAICKRLDVTNNSGDPQRKALKNWLHEINILRNQCAHHSRIWNRDASNAVTLLKNDYFNKLDLDEKARKKIYSKICILWYLVKRIGPNSGWIERVADLIDSKPDVECLPYTSMGFLDNKGFPRSLFGLPNLSDV